ncbi:MAG: beta-propeller fold lactonase family protein [Lachnospiraceae bacterium]|nr:beta-propeller fold lactonase family protein [Lachnospiraceae bacterium]
MAKEKYVAYVGTYTHENSIGIHVYDIDLSNGRFTERSVAPINNPSYLCVSHDGSKLYSIEDEGVCAFDIDENGDLTKINSKWIGGMRGCYLDIDSKRRYLFVGGYHDGRVTMMKLNEDGSIDGIADGIFHQGLAISANDRRFDHPKVSCVQLTPDERYLCAVDYGLNQVKVYKVDYVHGKLHLEDIVRCELDAGPRSIRFSNDGKICYILAELANVIEVYTYKLDDNEPVFERIQIVPTITKEEESYSASACMAISREKNYIFVSIDGYNGVSWLSINEDGTLKYENETQTSGDFPKSLAVLPGDDFLGVLNHDTNQITTFAINHDENFLLMKNPPVNVDKPNCIRIHKL